jgi:hypothetical protein
MALSVYKVDGNTRLVLPDSRWGWSVREKLAQLGHKVDLTGEEPEVVQRTRSVEELEKAMALIDSTGE